MTLTKIARPEQASEDSLWFKDETGKIWHVDLEWRDPTPRDQEGPNDLSVCVHVDSSEDTECEITHTHTFTEEELAAKDFDPDARVIALVDDLVHRRRSVVASKGALADLRDRVKRDQPIKVVVGGKNG